MVIALLVLFVVLVIFAMTCSTCGTPAISKPDKPIAPAAIDAGVGEARIQDELQRRVDALEGRITEVEQEQQERRATFATMQRDDLAHARAGGRAGVASWLNEYESRAPSSPSSSSSH